MASRERMAATSSIPFHSRGNETRARDGVVSSNMSPTISRCAPSTKVSPVQVLGEAFECERIFQTDVISGMEAPRLEADFIGVLPNLKLCGLFYPGRVVDAIVLTRAGSWEERQCI